MQDRFYRNLLVLFAMWVGCSALIVGFIAFVVWLLKEVAKVLMG